MPGVLFLGQGQTAKRGVLFGASSKNIRKLKNITPETPNQRTNGPVNAHLISRPCKTTKPEKTRSKMTLTFNDTHGEENF